MKTKLFIISIAFAGLASCAQRATCPTYSMEPQHEIKIKENQQKSV